jgi:hypothetical protein
MNKFAEIVYNKQKLLLQEKLCSVLQNHANSHGFIMYFTLGDTCFATTEDGRIGFKNIKSPMKGTMVEDDFEAINLDKLVNGKNNKEFIEKSQINKISVKDFDTVCKILSDKYKLFTLPK